MARKDTRIRILVASLTLFNEHGEPNTTTNDIADEADISPGNLHYHFRRKSDVVEALLLEFQADSRQVLKISESGQTSIEDFWAFLQQLLELLAAYRFLLRDTETLVENYPRVSKALGGFSRALGAVIELFVRAMRDNATIEMEDDQVEAVCRNLVVIALFSERYDEISGAATAIELSALRTARSAIGILRPYASAETKAMFAELA